MGTVAQRDDLNKINLSLIAIGKGDVYAVKFDLGVGIEHTQTIVGGFGRKLGIIRK